MIFMYPRYWTIYSSSMRYFGLQSSIISSYKVIQGKQPSGFGQEYVHQRRAGCTEFGCWSIKSNWWQSRSIASDVNNKAESLEVAKQKSKPIQWWVQYQLDELQKKHSSSNKKIIRKSSTIESMMYSTKNIEAVRDQMQQFDDIFKVMLDVQKE